MDNFIYEEKRDTDWIHNIAKNIDIQCRISEIKSIETRFELPIRNISLKSDYGGASFIQIHLTQLCRIHHKLPVCIHGFHSR